MLDARMFQHITLMSLRSLLICGSDEYQAMSAEFNYILLLMLLSLIASIFQVSIDGLASIAL